MPLLLALLCSSCINWYLAVVLSKTNFRASAEPQLIVTGDQNLSECCEVSTDLRQSRFFREVLETNWPRPSKSRSEILCTDILNRVIAFRTISMSFVLRQYYPSTSNLHNRLISAKYLEIYPNLSSMLLAESKPIAFWRKIRYKWLWSGARIPKSNKEEEVCGLLKGQDVCSWTNRGTIRSNQNNERWQSGGTLHVNSAPLQKV